MSLTQTPVTAPYLFSKPTPSVGSQLARAGSCWLEQGWGRVGGAQAEVWKQRPATTSSLSQPIEQESKSPSEFLSGTYPAASTEDKGCRGGARWERGASSLPDRQPSRMVLLGKTDREAERRGYHCQLSSPRLLTEPERAGG